MNHCKDAKAEVTETRRAGDAVYRRRRCTACGQTFVTVEQLFNGPIPVRSASRELARAAKRRDAAATALMHVWARDEAAHYQRTLERKAAALAKKK